VAMALQLVDSSDASTPLVVGVTSAIGGESKTANCLGLGSAVAKQTDARVIVAEFEIGSPGLAKLLDIPSRPGLIEHVTEGRPLEEVVFRTNVANLDVVVGGGEEHRDEDGEAEWDIGNHPGLTKLRRNMPEILAYLKEKYSYILLDMSPVLTNPYTKEMVNATDGVFLSVRAGVTPTEHMARAAQEIGGEKLSGVMLVGAKSALPRWVVDLLSGSE